MRVFKNRIVGAGAAVVVLVSRFGRCVAPGAKFWSREASERFASASGKERDDARVVGERETERVNELDAGVLA